MSWIEDSLNRIETRLRAMIEGEYSRDGIPRKLHTQLDQALAHAMQTGVRKKLQKNENEEEVLFAPDQYTLVMPAEQANILLSHPVVLDRLAQKLLSYAAHYNLILAAPPMLRVVADPNSNELGVLVEFSHSGIEDSVTTELEGFPAGLNISSDRIAPKAFLIVNGLTTYPLTRSVINIGSDPTNQLVLKNPNISLIHAQLRLNTDHFIIFDLDSKIGTLVNGVAVSSHVLSPGDVILLAGVPLVYGQETPSREGYTQKLPTNTQSPEVL